jgi:hypothetical protein
LLDLVRVNPGLAIVLALLGACALVLGLLALIMARAGASLRPLAWLGGFMALVIGPQLAGHTYNALALKEQEAPRSAALARMTARPAAHTDDARALFGADVDPALVVDVRAAYGDVLRAAESAQFAALPSGDSALLARFADASAAEQAWLEYLRVSGLSAQRGEGDSVRGYAVTRLAGDRAYVYQAGRMLGVWTGKDDAAIRARMAAGGFDVPGNAPLAAGTGTRSTLYAGALPTPLLFALAVPYLFVVVLFYFKGAAWAGTRPAKPGTSPVAEAELRARLQSLNDLDVPFRIESGREPGTLIASVRYGDAKWLDLARARTLRRAFRVRLTLDPSTNTVRATDFFTRFDASVGADGVSAEWRAGLGIVFFQVEHERVLGLQLDTHGRFTPNLSYAYSFDLRELKEPLIAAVTRAGWRYRPTIWEGPRWLHWLTA